MNEPPIAGLPDLCYLLTVWGKILMFQADVLKELEKDPSITCPFAIANFGSTVEGESTFIKFLTCCCGTPKRALDRFKSYANQNRLILSFHYYAPPATGTFEEVIQLAKKNAANLGDIPIYLSEYFERTAQGMADRLAQAVNEGANAVTYWQYVDSTYTQQDGWYIYPFQGQILDGGQTINEANWAIYSKTVADGTFWGALITGAGGGEQNVLELVPATTNMEAVKGVKPVWPPKWTPLHHGPKCILGKQAEDSDGL